MQTSKRNFLLFGLILLCVLVLVVVVVMQRRPSKLDGSNTTQGIGPKREHIVVLAKRVDVDNDPKHSLLKDPKYSIWYIRETDKKKASDKQEPDGDKGKEEAEAGKGTEDGEKQCQRVEDIKDQSAVEACLEKWDKDGDLPLESIARLYVPDQEQLHGLAAAIRSKYRIPGNKVDITKGDELLNNLKIGESRYQVDSVVGSGEIVESRVTKVSLACIGDNQMYLRVIYQDVEDDRAKRLLRRVEYLIAEKEYQEGVFSAYFADDDSDDRLLGCVNGSELLQVAAIEHGLGMDCTPSTSSSLQAKIIYRSIKSIEEGVAQGESPKVKLKSLPDKDDIDFSISYRDRNGAKVSQPAVPNAYLELSFWGDSAEELTTRIEKVTKKIKSPFEQQETFLESIPIFHLFGALLAFGLLPGALIGTIWENILAPLAGKFLSLFLKFDFDFEILI